MMLCAGCSVEEMSSLRSLTKPYAGEYRCTALLLGGRELLGEGDSVTLTLTTDGTFAIEYRMGGAEGRCEGSYFLDPEGGGGVFCMQQDGKEARFAVVYEAGSISFQTPLCGKLLYITFSMP